MSPPREPFQDSITNSAGIDDRWSCPACYADHPGHFDGKIIECGCSHSFKATLDYEPVCRSELLTDDDQEDDV